MDRSKPVHFCPSMKLRKKASDAGSDKLVLLLSMDSAISFYFVFENILFNVVLIKLYPDSVVIKEWIVWFKKSSFNQLLIRKQYDYIQKQLVLKSMFVWLNGINQRRKSPWWSLHFFWFQFKACPSCYLNISVEMLYACKTWSQLQHIWVSCMYSMIRHSRDRDSIVAELRKVWRYQMGNQKLETQEVQTIQWPNEKEQKYKQLSTKHYTEK